MWAYTIKIKTKLIEIWWMCVILFVWTIMPTDIDSNIYVLTELYYSDRNNETDITVMWWRLICQQRKIGILAAGIMKVSKIEMWQSNLNICVVTVGQPHHVVAQHNMYSV